MCRKVHSFLTPIQKTNIDPYKLLFEESLVMFFEHICPENEAKSCISTTKFQYVDESAPRLPIPSIPLTHYVPAVVTYSHLGVEYS